MNVRLVGVVTIYVMFPCRGIDIAFQILIQRCQWHLFVSLVGELKACCSNQCECHAHAERCKADGVVLLEWSTCSTRIERQRFRLI